METKELIYKTLKKSKEPLGSGDLVKMTGLDKKEVDKAMASLKKEGKITSPVRCKWTAQ